VLGGVWVENLILIDADYAFENGKPTVLLYCKDSKNKSVLVKDSTFYPYFYILPASGQIKTLTKKIKDLDEKKLDVKVVGVEAVEKVWQNKNVKLVKITIDNPRRIHDVRDAVKDFSEVEDTFEYDIAFYRRYIIDKQIEPTSCICVKGDEINEKRYQVDRVLEAKEIQAQQIEGNVECKFKILAFDTEFVDENGKSKLIMLSVASEGFKKVITMGSWKKQPEYLEVVENEKEILERFLEVVKQKDPDFICGYNSDGFDFPMIKDRAAEAKVSLKIGRDNAPLFVVRRGRVSSAKSKGRVHIDLFNFVDHVLSAGMKSEVLTLDAVAQELLGMGKKEMKYQEMKEIWSRKEDMERLAEYSAWDSELTLKLARHLLPQILTLSKITGQLPFDTARYTYSQLVEAFLMKCAFQDNVLIPNRPKTDEIERRRMLPVYRGAIVIEPKKGIHSDILVFDFRSLYPTIIVTHNIDPWTFNFKPCKKKEHIPEGKSYFCADKKGFIPKHLEFLITRRKFLKDTLQETKKDTEEHMRLDNMQYALKILANATYGYAGYFGAKWYGREGGAAAASWGRYYITKVVELAKKEGFEIIYGDTDSLMIKIPKELSQEKLREMGEIFADKANEQLPGIIELEFRDLYEGGIFVAREKGVVGAKKRYALLDYSGKLEIRGFETVRRDWCDLAKKIQRDVLVTVLKEKNLAKAVGLVKETVNKIKEGKVDLEDLVISEQITRPLSSYEQIGPHVRAAQRSQEKGRPIGEGTIIAFVIVKGKGSISDRAIPVEDVKPNQYDPEYYVNNQIVPVSMRVLKALGITEQELVSGKTQKKLQGFFKK
jgi:DNA polymerase I/DNA polymerase-2